MASNPSEVALTTDKKNYNAGKYIYSIAQVEEVNFGNFNTKFDELLKAVNQIVEKEKLSFFGLIITNLPKETSLMLATGSPKLTELLPYTKIKPNLYDLPSIMSRKKQLHTSAYKSIPTHRKRIIQSWLFRPRPIFCR